MSKAAISCILDKMESSGLIVRKKASEDGRKKEISLTAKGSQVAREVYSLLTSTEREIFSVLTGEELEIMNSIKEKLFNKLEELRC